MGPFVTFGDGNVERLFDKGLPPIWERWQREAVRLLFAHEASRDEPETVGDAEEPHLRYEEARRAHLALQRCLPQGHWGTSPLWYSTTCLDQELLKRFSLAGSRYQPLADPKVLVQNLRILRQTWIILWLWERTRYSPLLQYLIFYRPESRPVLQGLAEVASQPGFNFGKVSSTLDVQWHLLPLREPSWDRGRFETQVAILLREFALLTDRVVMGERFESEVRLDEKAHWQVVKDLVSSGNIFALVETIRTLVYNQRHPEILMELAQQSEYSEVVVAAFKGLAAFDNADVTEFLFGQLRRGSFKVHLLAAKAILVARDRRGVEERLSAMRDSANPFDRAVAEKMLAALRVNPPLPSDIESLDRWMREGGLFGEEGGAISWNSDTYTTQFFRYPLQLEAMATELKRRLTNDPTCDQHKVVVVGGSWGAEAVSLLIHLDADYRQDPASWDHVNPLDRIRLFSTDIDPVALAYARRGRFAHHPCWQLTDDFGLAEHLETCGTSLHRYFAAYPESGAYWLRPEWRDQIVVTALDVLSPSRFFEKEGRPEGVIYNMVDGHLPGPSLQLQAADRVSAMPTGFVATIPRHDLTRRHLLSSMALSQRSDWSYLFYPNGQAVETGNVAEGPTCRLPTLDDVTARLIDLFHYPGGDALVGAHQAKEIVEDLGGQAELWGYSEGADVVHVWIEVDLVVDSHLRRIVIDLVGPGGTLDNRQVFDRCLGPKEEIVQSFPMYGRGQKLKETPVVSGTTAGWSGQELSPEQSLLYGIIAEWSSLHKPIDSRDEIIDEALKRWGLESPAKRLDLDAALRSLEARGVVVLQ